MMGIENVRRMEASPYYLGFDQSQWDLLLKVLEEFARPDGTTDHYFFQVGDKVRHKPGHFDPSTGIVMGHTNTGWPIIDWNNLTTPGSMQRAFTHDPAELEVIPFPDFHVGDFVQVIAPDSHREGECGEIVGMHFEVGWIVKFARYDPRDNPSPSTVKLFHGLALREDQLRKEL